MEHIFEIKDNILMGYHGNAVDLVIPSEVSAIARNAFSKNTRIRSVRIPEGVEKIDGRAFSYCTRLKSIVLPDSLMHLGAFAFDGCYALKEIHLPANLSSIGDYAFLDCIRLEMVSMPRNLQTIGKNAFSGCSALKKIDFPDELKHIGFMAFHGCKKIRSVRIPEGTTVEGGAFNGCPLDHVDFGTRTNFDNIWDNGLRLLAERCIFCGSVMEESEDLPGMCCSGCGRYFSYESMEYWPGFVVKDTVLIDHIGYGRVIPDGVTKIAYRAFEDAVVPDIVFPSSLSEIEPEAFLICDFALPPSLYNTKLKRLESNVFCGSNIGYISLPETLEYLGKGCMSECEFLTTLDIPDNVQVIDSRALAECTSLRTVTLGKRVKYIGEEAFEGCISLESIEMASSVLIIGPRAFMGCRHLEEIRIPERVTTIGNEAFMGCTHLKKVYLPKALSNIEFDRIFDPNTKIEYY